MRGNRPVGLGHAAIREVEGRERHQAAGLRESLGEEEPELVVLNRTAHHGVGFVAEVELRAGLDERPEFVGDVIALERTARAEVAPGAGEPVPAFLGDRVHAHATQGAFGRLRSRVVHQLGLGKLVDTHSIRLAARTGQVLADVHAVEIDVLIERRGPVHRHGAHEALREEADARYQARSSLNSARRREHVQDLAIEHRLILRALHVNDWGRAGHSHGLFDGPDRQRRVDLRGKGTAQLDAFASDLVEPLELEEHRVGAGSEVDDGVAARAVGHDRADLFDEDIARGLDGRAGEDGPGAVGHDADDACPLLGGGRRREREDR